MKKLHLRPAQDNKDRAQRSKITFAHHIAAGILCVAFVSETTNLDLGHTMYQKQDGTASFRIKTSITPKVLQQRHRRHLYSSVVSSASRHYSQWPSCKEPELFSSAVVETIVAVVWIQKMTLRALTASRCAGVMACGFQSNTLRLS